MTIPQIWPVIHFKDLKTTLSNIELSIALGAEGVFLIDMEHNSEQLLNQIVTIRSVYPNFKLGLNLLTYHPHEALLTSIKYKMNATWVDDCNLSSSYIGEEAKDISNTLRAIPSHLFFGSVAFKYQPYEVDPVKAAKNASSLGFIPTTSGNETGVPPTIEKVSSMYKETGQLAIASGLDPLNVSEYIPFCSHILVSTGISKDFYNFDEDKLKQMMKNIKDKFIK